MCYGNESDSDFIYFLCCVPRAPREFAGSDGGCVACHPECKPQRGKDSCTGPVITLFDCKLGPSAFI